MTTERRTPEIPTPLISAGDEAWRAALVDALERAPSPGAALAGFERLIDAGGEAALLAWPGSDLADLACVLGSSNALTRWLTKFGSGWPEQARLWDERNPDATTLKRLAAIEAGANPEGLRSALRVLAARELYRIGVRDLLGRATLAETLAGITTLAEVALELAVRHLRAWLARDAGDVIGIDGKPVGFVVLGLGKLGGRELNYSSDVDLSYLYASIEVASGSPEARGFFTRLATEVTRAIGEPTADGLVFRVDLRLRPEGNAGALVNSVDAALAYYEGWGDTWERGALAKARPVAGDVELGRHFVEQARPFVYRRHLDFQTLEDLRRMKDRIDAEQSVEAPGVRNVKLGAGCIRELEFVVQALQLIHGGHEPAVQVVGTLAALGELERHHMISPEEARGLREAYAFLRDVEHAIQVAEQRQTQRLPAAQTDLRALARRLGYGVARRERAAAPGEEITAFERDWELHTQRVREAFVRFLELRPEERGQREPQDPIAVSILARIEAGNDDGAAHLLSAMGFPDGHKAADALRRLYRGRIAGPASPQRRRAVESMAHELLSAAVSSADPESALERLVDFLVRTGAHTSYLALLGGSRATMKLLVTVFATSPYLAGLLVGHPELIDLLVRSDRAGAVRDERTLEAELDEECAGSLDEEGVLAALRRFRNAAVLRIGMEDLAGAIVPEEVHVRLTSVADLCLRRATDEARRLLSSRGAPPQLELAILGLGKMGAREMTYASDLDLLFVYDSQVEGFDAEAHGFATRWVQKAMSLLQTRTRDGIAYAIDARLRPSGRSGPLVTSFDRFVDYHRNEAELWERQAHIRARVVYGSPGLAARIDGVVEQYVYGCGLDANGVRAIHALRGRIEQELAGESPRRRNIKTGRGGIVDVEFLVQMLQLRHGHAVRSLRVRGTLPGLRALRDAGLLPVDDAERLISDYVFLRRLEARMRLERDRPVEEIGTDTRVLAPLARRLGFDGPDPGAALLDAYDRSREEVRRIYERHFENVDV